MKDQYGNPVPNDLLVLVDLGFGFNYLEVEFLLNHCSWYQFDEYPGDIFVSAKEIDKLADYMIEPKDCHIDISDKQPYTIDKVLHRYSFENGFYHA